MSTSDIVLIMGRLFGAALTLLAMPGVASKSRARRR